MPTILLQEIRDLLGGLIEHLLDWWIQLLELVNGIDEDLDSISDDISSIEDHVTNIDNTTVNISNDTTIIKNT